MLRRRTVTTGCALVISVLALTAYPAVADPQPDATTPDATTASSGSDPTPPPAVLDAIQRDLGLSAAQAEARLANEARASATEAKLRGSLGASFAGSWVTGETSATLVVATTDAAQAPTIAGSGAQPQIVGRTLAALTAAKEALDRAAASAPSTTKQSTPVWYVDVRTNSVVVLSSQPAEAEAFVAASGADRAAVHVVRSAEQPQLYYDVRGGDAYYINNSARCSIGFSVRRGSTNGFVSAGHCGRPGYTTAGYNRVAQGTFQGSSFPGNDYSWVAVNSSWTSRPWVRGSGGGNVTVKGSAVAVEGSSICRSGSTTGWHCGTVQQRNTSVTYSQGTVYEVTRTNVCAEPGDSGGSFISGSQAQGVTSGGSGNCTFGGTTYFQPVNEILAVYGLTLATG
ncbi:alpha-lytic protease prodomain-containing protein [Planotetraspora sp. GP83]|uniref:alpha-lytic protease prodomain-containing protein n=1 Tax=Planotetraspora sp. GP83 TaxID=3156264 RepID=UPI003512C37E